MKTSIGLLCLPAFFVLVAGCGDSQTGPEAPPASAPSSASGSGEAPAKPFRQTSFQAVTSQLDAGGTVYGYVSLDQWLGGLSAKVSDLREFVLSLPDIPPSDRQTVQQGFDLARSLVKASGIESLDGVGMSGVQVGPELFRTKTILHHPEGAGEGFLWNLFGKQEHALEGLSLLPGNTALAFFGDLDLAGLWNVLEQELGRSGIAAVAEGVKAWPERFEGLSGLKWADVLASLGGEVGLVLTLDDARTAKIPVGPVAIEIPEPALLIALRIKNDLLYDRIIRDLKENPAVITTDEPGLKMSAMPIPLPIPIPLHGVVASSGDYLFLATSTNLVRTALAVRKGESNGVKDSPAFKELAQYLTLSGNQFSYADKRMAQAFMNIQKQVMASEGMPKEQASMMQKLFLDQAPTFALTVSSHTPTGWKSVAVGNQDASLVALAAPAAVVAIGAGLMLPALAKAKTKAQTISSVSNVKQIVLAARIYSNDHDDKFPPAETWCDVLLQDGLLTEKVLKAPGDTSPNRCSYAFNTRLSGRDEGAIHPQTVVFFESEGGWNKHGGKESLAPSPLHGNVYVFGFADGSVRQVPVSEVDTLRWDP